MAPKQAEVTAKQQKLPQEAFEQESDEGQGVRGRPMRKAAMRASNVWDNLVPGHHEGGAPESGAQQDQPDVKPQKPAVATNAAGKTAATVTVTPAQRGRPPKHVVLARAQSNVKGGQPEQKVPITTKPVGQGAPVMIRPMQRSNVSAPISKDQIREIERDVEKHQQFPVPPSVLTTMGGGGGNLANGARQPQQSQQQQNRRPAIITKRPSGVAGIQVRPFTGGGVMNAGRPMPPQRASTGAMLQGRVVKAPTGGQFGGGVQQSGGGGRPSGLYIQQSRPRNSGAGFVGAPIRIVHGNMVKSKQHQQIPFGGGGAGVYGGGGGPPKYMSESHPTYTTLVKELEELSSKYKERIIPGTTVHQFNSLINQLNHELERVVEDRDEVIKQYQDHLANLSEMHASEMALKDKRIQQLEGQNEMLEAKLAFAFRRSQMNLVKQATKSMAPIQPAIIVSHHTSQPQQQSQGGGSMSSSQSTTGATMGQQSQQTPASQQSSSMTAVNGGRAPTSTGGTPSSVSAQAEMGAGPELYHHQQQHDPNDPSAYEVGGINDEDDGEEMMIGMGGVPMGGAGEDGMPTLARQQQQQQQQQQQIMGGHSRRHDAGFPGNFFEGEHEEDEDDEEIDAGQYPMDPTDFGVMEDAEMIEVGHHVTLG